jgi:hypothetical protein
MRGPYSLNRVNITINVPDRTGVLLLICGHRYEPVYVERSEHLRKTLINHLPENEKSTDIEKRSPDLFMFQTAKDERKAFDLECRWYHLFKPKCNFDHPAYGIPGVLCPVCSFET